MAEFWLGQKAASRGYRLFSYASVGSTSDEAARAARSGDSGDVWFAALEQTTGRGRRGRPWETVRGNLAASLLVRPAAEAGKAAGLGFVAGIALGRALSSVVPGARIGVGIDGGSDPSARFALKWPNDVVVDGAKLAGILLEAHQLPSGLAVVVGFGVNVVAAPSGLPYPAVSLRDLGSAASAAELFSELSACWVDCYEMWNGGKGSADVLAEWRRNAAGIGSEIAVSRDGDVVRGIFESVDDGGRLIVRAPDQRLVTITAGDVHFGATASATR